MDLTTKTWISLLITTSLEEEDILTSLLAEAQTLGIQEEYIEGILAHRAYFSGNVNINEITEKLSQAFDLHHLERTKILHIEQIEQAPWEENWKQHFHPHHIVPGIIIAPSWENYIAADGEKVITLDPGMAFGTGLHETTILCAHAMEAIIKKKNEIAFLDIGTGSGILCLIARKLGVQRVLAVENDPDAVSVAEENFERNGEKDIPVFTSLRDVSSTFDLIVANILLNTLIALKNDLLTRLSPGGKLILSGVTNDQVSELVEAFKECELREHLVKKEWGCVVLKKIQGS